MAKSSAALFGPRMCSKPVKLGRFEGGTAVALWLRWDDQYLCFCNREGPGAVLSLLASSIRSYSTEARSMTAHLLPMGRRQSALASVLLRKKKGIDVVLERATDSVHSYSTHDQIRGQVQLNLDKDVPLDGLTITLERQAVHLRREVCLNCRRPQNEQQNSTPFSSSCSLLRADFTYAISFTFVVPDRLLPYALLTRGCE